MCARHGRPTFFFFFCRGSTDINPIKERPSEGHAPAIHRTRAKYAFLTSTDRLATRPRQAEWENVKKKKKAREKQKDNTTRLRRLFVHQTRNH